MKTYFYYDYAHNEALSHEQLRAQWLDAMADASDNETVSFPVYVSNACRYGDIVELDTQKFPDALSEIVSDLTLELWQDLGENRNAEAYQDARELVRKLRGFLNARDASVKEAQRK